AEDRYARELLGDLRTVLDDFSVSLEKSDNAAILTISQQQPLPVGASGRVFAFEWLLRMIHGLAAWLVARPLV
ncbi:MAG: AraC family transcriptional regulator, partial [Pseudomonadota bacterium]